jgi:hypothetical protein
MKLCPGEKCSHYHETDKKRSCYYEPGCWKGELSVLLSTLKLLFRRKQKNHVDENLPNHPNCRCCISDFKKELDMPEEQYKRLHGTEWKRKQ